MRHALFQIAYTAVIYWTYYTVIPKGRFKRVLRESGRIGSHSLKLYVKNDHFIHF